MTGILDKATRPFPYGIIVMAVIFGVGFGVIGAPLIGTIGGALLGAFLEYVIDRKDRAEIRRLQDELTALTKQLCA